MNKLIDIMSLIIIIFLSMAFGYFLPDRFNDSMSKALLITSVYGMFIIKHSVHILWRENK